MTRDAAPAVTVISKVEKYGNLTPSQPKSRNGGNEMIVTKSPKDRTGAERTRRYRAKMRAAGIPDSYRAARLREQLAAYEAGDWAKAGGLDRYPIKPARRRR